MKPVDHVSIDVDGVDSTTRADGIGEREDEVAVARTEVGHLGTRSQIQSFYDVIGKLPTRARGEPLVIQLAERGRKRDERNGDDHRRSCQDIPVHQLLIRVRGSLSSVANVM